MTESEKYQKVINQLKIIVNQINNLNQNLLQLEKLLQQNMKVNNKGYKTDEINTVNETLVNLSENIKNNTITNLYEKI